MTDMHDLPQWSFQSALVDDAWVVDVEGPTDPVVLIGGNQVVLYDYEPSCSSEDSDLNLVLITVYSYGPMTTIYGCALVEHFNIDDVVLQQDSAYGADT